MSTMGEHNMTGFHLLYKNVGGALLRKQTSHLRSDQQSEKPTRNSSSITSKPHPPSKLHTMQISTLLSTLAMIGGSSTLGGVPTGQQL
jgi:hypothetical protein